VLYTVTPVPYPYGVTWWVVGGVVGWLASAPVVAVATGMWFGRRAEDSVALEDALTVPTDWSAALPSEA
ncbi:Hypothetical protein KLENKIAIHU_2751, partial [Klenkia terrae]